MSSRRPHFTGLFFSHCLYHLDRRLRVLACLLLSWPCLLLGGSLRLATYNLENYTVTNRMTDEGYKRSFPKPEVSKIALHKVLREMDADFIAFQEMGTAPFLEELRQDLAAEGMNYPHGSVLEASDETRHLAFLSRLPVKNVWYHRNLTFKYFDKTEPVKRGVLEVLLETAEGPLTIWIVHLKSRFTIVPEDPGANLYRGNEATTIREMILRRHKDPQVELFAIMGDFNDSKGKRPIRAMEEKGKTIISDDLSAADDRGHRWTHFYKREESYEKLDHILLSPAARRKVLPPFGPEGPAARIIEIPACAVASDHRPLLVTLDLHPSAAAPR